MGAAVLVALALACCTTDHITPAPKGGQPNVLVILTDDQRSDTLAVMPATRRLFGDGGVRFTHAFATTPQCCPSRASILTGRYAHNHGVLTNYDADALDESTSVARYLQSDGYATAIAGKYLNRPERNPQASYLNPTKVGIDPAGFDHWSTFLGGYYGTLFNEDGSLRTVARYSTDHVASQAVAMLHRFERSDAQPWFLLVAPFAPHPIKLRGASRGRHPMAVPRRADAHAPVPRLGGSSPIEGDVFGKPPFVRRGKPLSPATARAVRASQLRSLKAVDELVRKTMAWVRRLREDDATLAFFLSDNGFLWGEHGLEGKGLPYTESIRIPLLLRWPSQLGAGTTDGRLVANLDVATTILDAAGIQPDHVVDGNSLLTSVERRRLLLEYWATEDSGVPSWASLRTPTSQYIEYYGPGGRVSFRELYDLHADPSQRHNLIRSTRQTQARLLARALAAARHCRGAPCP